MPVGYDLPSCTQTSPVQTLPGLPRQPCSMPHKSLPQPSMLTSHPVSLAVHVNTRSLSFSVPEVGVGADLFQEPRIYLTPCFIQNTSRKRHLRSHFTKIPINHASQEPLRDSFRTLASLRVPDQKWIRVYLDSWWDHMPLSTGCRPTGPGRYRGIQKAPSHGLGDRGTERA